MHFPQPLLPEEQGRHWQTPEPTERTPAFRALQLHLTKLSVDARFICAMIAIEMVLPVWLYAFPDNSAPQEVLEFVANWLHHDEPWDQTEYMELYRDDVLPAISLASAANPPAERVIRAAKRLMDAAYYEQNRADSGHEDWTTIDLTKVVQNAANAVIAEWSRAPLDTPEGVQFLRHWWSECRRRLAFRYPQRMELNGPIW